MAHPGASAAEHMDAIYRYQRFIYDASRKYYLLGRDRLIEELAPPPWAALCSRSPAGPGATSSRRRAATPSPLLRLRHLERDARHRARVRSSATALPTASWSRPAMPPTSPGSGCSACRRFDRVFVSYCAVDDPALARGPAPGLRGRGPGRPAAHRRLRRAGGACRSWFRTGLRAWLAKFSVDAARGAGG